MLDALIDRCCRWINVLIALALAVMVLMVFGNVVLRYAFNSGIAVSEEVSRWLFVWITFLGAIVAIREHGHLGTDMLLVKLPPLAQRACLVVAHGLMLFLGTLFAPIEDRDQPGGGFTHKLGDLVSIQSAWLGGLHNRVTHSEAAPPWRFGLRAFMGNLAQRGLLQGAAL